MCLSFFFGGVTATAHGQDPCSCLKKSVAYLNWFALPERPASDACAPFVLPEYLKMALSKSVMRNVARFRIRGLKCETGLYGRSPDRSARVCNLCENGDIQDEKHIIFPCTGTEHLRHQFNHMLSISDGDIKVFVFQHNSDVYKFISAAVDLFDCFLLGPVG